MDSSLLAFTLATPLGHLAVAGRDGVLYRLFMNCPSSSAAIALLERAAGRVRRSRWNEALAERLAAYAEGCAEDLGDVPIDVSHLTPFQQRVVEVVRRIPRGATRSYGEVAKIAGKPGAARAVGSVMAQNRVPLAVPCHRVVAANGLGGFSAPNGLQLKRRLLKLESAVLESRC